MYRVQSVHDRAALQSSMPAIGFLPGISFSPGIAFLTNVLINVNALPDLFVQTQEVGGPVSWFGDQHDMAILNLDAQVVSALDVELSPNLSGHYNLMFRTDFHALSHCKPP